MLCGVGIAPSRAAATKWRTGPRDPHDASSLASAESCGRGPGRHGGGLGKETATGEATNRSFIGGGFVPQALPAKGSKSRGFILGVSAANGIDAPLRGEEKASAAKPLTPYSVGAASHGSRSRLHEIWRCDRPRPRSSRLREKAASMRVRVPVSATYHMTRCARGR